MSQPFRIKYRPTTFSAMVGLERVLPTIKSIVQEKRITPVIVTGPNGSGKSTLLEIFGKRLACMNPDGLEPCQKCESCDAMDIRRGGMDVFTHSGAELTASLFAKLKRDFDSFPMSNSMLTIIIDDLDHAQPGMFKNLIRLMEVNEEHLFLFTATKVDSLPQPLLHRCKRLSLSNYSTETLKALLLNVVENEEIEVESWDAVEDLIELADRNPRSILNALEAIKDNNIGLSASALDVPSVRYNLGGDQYE